MFITVSGISGAGKTTLIKEAMRVDKQLVMPPSVVTRKKRADDNASDYIYLTHEEFQDGITNNIFLEYQQYREHYYGLLKDSYDNIVKDGNTAIRDMAFEGILQMKKQISDISNILVLTNFDLIYNRLIKRGDSPESINKRLIFLEEEVNRLKQIADYILYNNGLLDDSQEEFNMLVKHIKRKRF